MGGVRGEGSGGGCGGRGPAHRRRAASPRRPAPRPSHPPGPPQNGDTALDDAKKQKHTEVIKLLENAPAIAAQVGRAAPHPATPPPRPCAVCDRAWSRIPGCSLTQRPRALSPDHSSPSTPYLKMGTQCICTHIYRRRRVATCICTHICTYIYAFVVICICICVCIYVSHLPLPPPLPQPHPQVQHRSTLRSSTRLPPQPLHRLSAGAMK